MIMKPIYIEDIPTGDEWLYEIKYDGFRAVLSITTDERIQLQSKNNHNITGKFPEITASLKDMLPSLKKFLPLTLDGELVVLNNRYQANFAEIQIRGRMKNNIKITQAAASRPANFIVFDVLQANGKNYTEEKLSFRKAILEEILTTYTARVFPVKVYYSKEKTIKTMFDSKAEGIVAKRLTSKYKKGKNHQDWKKVKNWRQIFTFLTAFDTENGYFDVGVYHNGNVIDMGKCKHGLDPETYTTVKQFFIENGKKAGNRYTVPPAICTAVHTLDLYDNELREPEFVQLIPEMKPEACTFQKMQLDLAMLPKEITLTNTDKLLWKEPKLAKGDLLTYIREISPYILPFLNSRLLTIIRAPDGVDKESFFQRHLPSYAPEFVTAIRQQEETFFSCDNLETLSWFANHGAIEYHIPFERSSSTVPCEIVFDLDPPDRNHFHLAVQAAQLIKILLDELKLHSFIKTSGNKGLQIHIPIREGSMTYEETAIFTEAIAKTLATNYPDDFTTERMKKKRAGRLYIDYVQHGEGKTIIAPYSPRLTKEGTVATPLFWDEVDTDLNPSEFTIETVARRAQDIGCPFQAYFPLQQNQQMKHVLRFVRGETGSRQI
ncbi:DNA ligase D [Oceanobacillus sp. AG]|uniref:DNA ligase D n=1 Tax=Oceanobacillus sp. AG TaxID=2681969 RepID=UPI001E4BFE88|nr:DNA ligase D [Oceanobacillus sp. AG]